jgi:hypothetical protein
MTAIPAATLIASSPLAGHSGDVAEHLGQPDRQHSPRFGRVGLGHQAQVRYVLLHGGPSRIGRNVVFHPIYHSVSPAPLPAPPGRRENEACGCRSR